MLARTLLLAGLLALTACAHSPPTIAPHHTCGTGWDDCAWQQGWNDA